MAFDAALSSSSEWSARCEHWIEDERKSARPRGRRQRSTQPLILCGHGVSLRVDDGSLLIRNGRTHHPHEPETYRFFNGDSGIPPRIIMLDGSGCISFDVLDWLAAQNVPLVRINWKGEVVSVLAGHGFAADREKVRWQVETRADPARRLSFASDLVRRKLAASVATLENALPLSKARTVAITTAVAALRELSDRPPSDLTALRLTEAVCASAYFRAWRSIAIHWKSTARRPIPEDWRTFTSRTSLANKGKLLNINASHPINAMLNYAYGVLETELRIRAIGDGYDPTIGIMHHSRRQKAAYAFDLMEPERPKVDAILLGFAQEQVLSRADFVIRSDGVCRLSPQLARRVCQLVQ